ncbi:MAG TPA: helix-turn-helix domain-containing protein [Prolixibacteraceae bacterium]|nr:helix-turn-helix domain-containing protein [Prolixibacteraceae bacterium]
MSTETIIYQLEQVVKLLKEQNMLLKRVFNSRDAALYLGISLDTLYHLTGKNKIPCYKMNGHKLFFSHEELEKWLLSKRKENKAKSKEPAPAFGLN